MKPEKPFFLLWKTSKGATEYGWFQEERELFEAIFSEDVEEVIEALEIHSCEEVEMEAQRK